MGNRARKERAKYKAFIRKNGLYENELGELKKRITKAEARRRLVDRFLFRRQYLSMMEADIMEAAIQKAHEEIIQIEDARILAELDARAMEMG
jgi:hypothetical protein